jgi:O-antigen/teichoic acid export membrane protein
VTRIASVLAFFGLRVGVGLLLLKLSARFLPVAGFTQFSQFLAFAALLNLMAVGGAQSGLIRQAAAADDGEDLAATRGAAFMIWGAALAVLTPAIALASGAISHILTGGWNHGSPVMAIAALTLPAGAGQIWCGLLSGRGKVVASLSAQALGLATGAAAAAWLIIQNRPIEATLAFAAGGLVTTAAAGVLIAPLKIPAVAWSLARTRVRPLVRYSAALAATTGFSALILFGLRAHYRESFGHTELGYWMAANRVSDMSTQLLGLFMIQSFVPRLARQDDPAAARRLALRFWAAGAAGMATAAAAFALGARLLVHLFLSDAYLPAIPVIQTYMVGDVCRVWASIAMYSAFARGQPGRYAAIEMGALGLMAAITVTLATLGEGRAPQLGYAGAYAIVAVIVSLSLLRGAWRRQALA